MHEELPSVRPSACLPVTGVALIQGNSPCEFHGEGRGALLLVDGGDEVGLDLLDTVEALEGLVQKAGGVIRAHAGGRQDMVNVC
ncbi:hypothetical protein ACR808_13870 [Halomonas sp. RA08-2]